MYRTIIFICDFVLTLHNESLKDNKHLGIPGKENTNLNKAVTPTHFKQLNNQTHKAQTGSSDSSSGSKISDFSIIIISPTIL